MFLFDSTAVTRGPTRPGREALLAPFTQPRKLNSPNASRSGPSPGSRAGLLRFSAPSFAGRAGRCSQHGAAVLWQNRLGERGQRFRFYSSLMVRNFEDVLDEFLSCNDMARTELDTQKVGKGPADYADRQIIPSSASMSSPILECAQGRHEHRGPRPCMERQRSLYGKGWEHYIARCARHHGPVAGHGRNRLSYARRVELDVEYVSNWSLWLDFKILCGRSAPSPQGRARDDADSAGRPLWRQRYETVAAVAQDLPKSFPGSQQTPSPCSTLERLRQLNAEVDLRRGGRAPLSRPGRHRRSP